MPERRIVIVGAGIIGASIAYHIARRGVQVTVLEQREPAAAATGSSFAWINASFKQPQTYFDLNRSGMRGWRRLQSEIGPEQLVIQWGGAVRWEDQEKKVAWHRDAVSRQQVWGYKTRLVAEEEIRELLPNVDPGRVLIACYCDEDGALDAIAATNAILKVASEVGAEVIYPCAVTGFDIAAGRIRGVIAGERCFGADTVILAAGVGVPKLAGMLATEVPLINSAGILAHGRPAARVVDKVVIAPRAQLTHLPNGKLVISANAAVAPTRGLDVASSATLVAEAVRYVKALDGTAFANTVGWRVMPEDGFPVVGRLDNVAGAYVAVMHSGITLAPVIGQLVAIEILERIEVEALRPYRPSRLQS
jgi:glycine/D-amino acid oxidase-like deaminating enzyme